jgi:hypothetical protein
MDDDILRYDVMVETALRGVIRQALVQAAEHGLPGDHHFYLTFRTNYPGVELPDHLSAQFPEEMTIALQHQFWDLIVGDDAFEVGLSFNRAPERVAVPFAAITAFADPEVKFGLKFQFDAEGEPLDDDETALDQSAANTEFAIDEPPAADAAAADAAEDAGADSGASVVQLDAFRNKPSSGKTS